MSKQIIFKTFHIFWIPCNQFPIFFSSKVPEDSFWRFKCGKCCLYLTSMMLQYYFMCVLWQKPHNSEVSWIVPKGLIFHKHHCHTINSFEIFFFFPPENKPLPIHIGGRTLSFSTLCLSIVGQYISLPLHLIHGKLIFYIYSSSHTPEPFFSFYWFCGEKEHPSKFRSINVKEMQILCGTLFWFCVFFPP